MMKPRESNARGNEEYCVVSCWDGSSETSTYVLVSCTICFPKFGMDRTQLLFQGGDLCSLGLYLFSNIRFPFKCIPGSEREREEKVISPKASGRGKSRRHETRCKSTWDREGIWDTREDTLCARWCKSARLQSRRRCASVQGVQGVQGQGKLLTNHMLL